MPEAAAWRRPQGTVRRAHGRDRRRCRARRAAALSVAESLNHAAAIGLTLLMLGAAYVHLRCGEARHPAFAIVLVLAALTGTLAGLRLGPYGSEAAAGLSGR
ncbi:DoxX family protein [Luteipulveratus halotolerans]|uniref:DoxX family protein n=1 Tax=Luteipulveratus halotolerans TaxID=1631356 RepID=UPI0008FBE343